MKIVEIIFSPTGGTRKVADLISGHWSEEIVKIDLCDAKDNFSGYEIAKEDRVLIAMPSFGGRAPLTAIERLKKIRGNGADAVLVCVYGNRAYEDTLAEMEDAAKECGFQVIAGVAAVAEHSILPQYAAGRPDQSDERQLADFAEQIAGQTGTVFTLPGNRPYRKYGGVGLVPKPGKNCIRCGLCVKKCPVQAIDPADFTADSKTCISCMRCVKRCPAGARKVNGVMVSAAAVALKKACSQRKENELFL
ncbi:MAG: 4Fe-4S binding protein [Lachnospiraceae bacterium]|nr:4Fe-4S binding protein [Lachnospiraceae bacterium]